MVRSTIAPPPLPPLFDRHGASAGDIYPRPASQLTPTIVVPEVRLFLRLEMFEALRANPYDPLISQTAQFIAERIRASSHPPEDTRGLPQAVDAFVREHADDPSIVEAERALLLLRQHAGIGSVVRRSRVDLERDVRDRMLGVFLRIPATTIALSSPMAPAVSQPTPATTTGTEPAPPPLPAPTKSMLRRRMRFHHEVDDR